MDFFFHCYKFHRVTLYLKLPCSVSPSFAEYFPARLLPVFLLPVKTNQTTKNHIAKKRTIGESCAASL